MDDDTVRRFAALFEGNHQAVGKVWGEAANTIDDQDWLTALADHLVLDDASASVGVYPLVTRDDPRIEIRPDGENDLEAEHGFTSDLWVKWGCTDLDEGYEKSLPEARQVCTALDLMGIVGFVERTKGKGYHVWVFTDQWVPAEVMRRALLAAHQAAGVRATEVNPKQTSLDGLKGYGNYVNLPYFKGADEGRRVVIGYLGGPEVSGDMALGKFLEVAEQNLTTFDTLLAAAQLYVEPPRHTCGEVVEYDGTLDDLTGKLNGLAYTIFKKGPLKGNDRSDTLARLCHKVFSSGLTSGECMMLLRDADRRWGKFSERPDCEHQLLKLVENAYA